MGGSDLLGPERHHDERMAVRRPPIPLCEELGRQLVGPLAIVEEDDRGTHLRAQRVQNGDQRGQRPRLAMNLRTELDGRLLAKDLRQIGKSRDRGGREFADSFSYSGAKPRLFAGRGNQTGHHAGQCFEWPRRDLIEALAAEHQGAPTRRLEGEFVQQTGLSAPRFALHCDQASAASACALECGAERIELLLAADERGLRDDAASIVQAEHELRFRHSPVQCRSNRFQVRQYGLRALVPLPRILAQQPLDELVDRPRNRNP